VTSQETTTVALEMNEGISLLWKLSWWLEQSVRRQRPTKARIGVGQPTKKPLSVRYAELLKLRQTVLQAETRAKPPRVDRRASE
jgi:hypothetical protein